MAFTKNVKGMSFVDSNGEDFSNVLGTLDLSDDQITKISEALFQFKIHPLNLSNNNLTDISGLKILDILSLSDFSKI